MIHLPTVTLLQIDTISEARAIRAQNECTKAIQFAEVKLLQPESVLGYEDYNRFVVTELYNHFDTSHCLLIQWDGYVINPEAWSDEFLQYDYIGAPWDTNIVGNGGFSLRSKRFCKLTTTIKAISYAPEDVLLCRTQHRDVLEAAGMKYAPADIAARFSFEVNERYRRYEGAFGFHRVNPLGK